MIDSSTSMPFQVAETVELPSNDDLDLQQARKRKRSESALQTPLETYLREINETRLLTAQEEKDLAKARVRVEDLGEDEEIKVKEDVFSVSEGGSHFAVSLETVLAGHEDKV